MVAMVGMRSAPKMKRRYKANFFIVYYMRGIAISFIYSSHSTEASKPHKPYLWSRSKCWMRACGANIQRAATKITNMAYGVYWLRL